MAAAINWPGTLPQSPTINYEESGGVNILRTPTDSGIAKSRRRGIRPDSFGVSFQMTPAQVTAFETFVKTTIRGVTRFGFPHPRKGSVVDVKIVPEGEGKLYSLAYLSPTLWLVSFSVEVLP